MAEISVSHKYVSVDTIGTIVIDNENDKPCLLSNWHVLSGPTGRVDGMGFTNEIRIPHFGFLCRARAHFRAGHVLKTGGEAAVRKGNEYMRVGPQLEFRLLTVDLGFTDRLTLRASYEYLYGLTNKSGSGYKFSSGAQFRLDENGKFSLGLDSTREKLADTQQKANEITLSLKVKV